MFKHGKRLAALALTALLCLPVAAYAEEELTVYSVDGINVYTVEDEFTVTIPTKVEIKAEENKANFNIEAKLEKCSNLEIKIKSENEYKLMCGSQGLKYSVSDEKVVFSKKYEDETTEEQSYKIYLEVMDTPTMSGTYEDYLTFEINREPYIEVEGKHLLNFDTNAILNSEYEEELVISTKFKYVDNDGTYGMLPTPRRDGYDFDGWYTEKTAGNKVKEDTTASAGAAETVYAHWTPHVLTINYHNDGAEYIKWESGWSDPDHKQYVTGEDVSTFHTETYGENFSNGVNGLYDVWRWKKTGYTAKGSVWKIGEYGTEEYNDHEPFVKAEDCAKYLGVLEDFKKGDVTVDLYPIWIATGKTIAEIDAEEQEPDEIIGTDDPGNIDEDSTTGGDTTDSDVDEPTKDTDDTPADDTTEDAEDTAKDSDSTTSSDDTFDDVDMDDDTTETPDDEPDSEEPAEDTDEVGDLIAYYPVDGMLFDAGFGVDADA